MADGDNQHSNGAPGRADGSESVNRSEVQEIKHGIGLGFLAGAALLAVVFVVAGLLSSGDYFVDGTGQFRIERVCKKTAQCVKESSTDQCRADYQVLQDRDKLTKAQRRERAIIVQCLQGMDMGSSCKSILDCLKDKVAVPEPVAKTR